MAVQGSDMSDIASSPADGPSAVDPLAVTDGRAEAGGRFGPKALHGLAGLMRTHERRSTKPLNLNAIAIECCLTHST